jgi:hypothetical protein
MCKEGIRSNGNEGIEKEGNSRKEKSKINKWREGKEMKE